MKPGTAAAMAMLLRRKFTSLLATFGLTAAAMAMPLRRKKLIRGPATVAASQVARPRPPGRSIQPPPSLA